MKTYKEEILDNLILYLQGLKNDNSEVELTVTPSSFEDTGTPQIKTLYSVDRVFIEVISRKIKPKKQRLEE